MKPILIAVAPYYQEIAEALVMGATQVASAAGFRVEVVTVPGAFELPAAIGYALRSERYSGYIALGCVIRGETSHYDYVCSESARGLQNLAVEFGAAIGYGILTCETLEQAVERSDPAQGDKGGEAARACIRMIELQHLFLGDGRGEASEAE
ncbi:MAG: 6,7-dimethyl-8-ribityllumazine synthase [Rickettsiales bacterium]|jgi:6,7-dimethyl-8-ribityllumazine synthase|nr:6,7-dimethyl-8-ribityllumazine synthase [Rickettsiales bacterium]